MCLPLFFTAGAISSAAGSFPAKSRRETEGGKACEAILGFLLTSLIIVLLSYCGLMQGWHMGAVELFQKHWRRSSPGAPLIAGDCFWLQFTAFLSPMYDVAFVRLFRGRESERSDR